MASLICETPSRTDLRKRIASVFDARRRSLQIDVDAGVITVAPSAQRSDVALMEFNDAGFRIATTEPVPANAVFESDLMTENGTRIQRPARVLYCRFQRPDGHDGGYVSRLEFVDGPDAA